MKSGRVSRTALKVALMLVGLAEREDWAERLPEGAGPLSERLLVSADVPMYRGGMIRRFKSAPSQKLIGRQLATYEFLGHRKLFMDRQVRAGIEAGARQVLILGAGFDTLCLRLAPRFPELRFWELDHPATSAAKARGVAAIGQPPNLSLIAADLGARKLPEVLAETERWDPGARSMLIAEGLLPYLTDAQIQDLFDDIRACVGPGSRLAFSHLSDLDSVGWLARLSLHMLGEPWLSSQTPEELPAYVASLGWRVLEQALHEPGLEGFAVAELA